MRRPKRSTPKRDGSKKALRVNKRTTTRLYSQLSKSRVRTFLLAVEYGHRQCFAGRSLTETLADAKKLVSR